MLKHLHLGYTQNWYKGKLYRSYNFSRSLREGKKVRKKIVIPVGPLSDEQVAQMRLLLKVAKGKLPQVLPLKEVDPLKEVSYLDVAVVSSIWDQWNISSAFKVSTRQGKLSTSLVAKILTINRCLHPHSHYSIPKWVKGTALPEMFSFPLKKLNDDKIYYELDKIHKNKEALESFLFQETFRRDPESYEFVNYDLSTSYFVGIKCNLSEFGRSKDDKGARRRQVILALMINDKGYPFKWDVLPGNTAEVKTLEDNINACVHRFGLRQISLVFDRGIVSDKNMELVDKKSLKYISALDKDQIPKIAGEELKAFSFLSPENIATEIKVLPGFREFDEHFYFKDLGELFSKRYILGINPELFSNERKGRQEKIHLFQEFLPSKNQELGRARRNRDKSATERAVVDKLRGLKIRKFFKKVELEEIKVKRYLKNGSEKMIKSFLIQVPIDQDKLKASQLLDGVCLFVSNHRERKKGKFISSAKKIILAYRHKEQIESAFKNIKSFLKIRPFYVNLDDHVEAVYTICVLAYFINRYLSHRRKEHEGKDFLNSKELYAPFSSGKLVTLKNNISGEIRRKIIPLERYQIALLKNIGLEPLAMSKLPENLSQVKPM